MPAPDIKILGISEEEAQEWAESVSARFEMWANSKQCTRNETMNFYQLQRLYHRNQQRDGENFVRLHYSNDKELMSPHVS